MFGLRDPRDMSEWEQGVLASRALLVVGGGSAIGAIVTTGLLQRGLAGIAGSAFVMALIVGFVAQQAYYRAGPLPGDEQEAE